MRLDDLNVLGAIEEGKAVPSRFRLDVQYFIADDSLTKRLGKPWASLFESMKAGRPRRHAEFGL